MARAARAPFCRWLQARLTQNVKYLHMALESLPATPHFPYVKVIHITWRPAMYSTTDTARPGGIRSALRRIEAWMDARGKWAWIAALVLSFIVFWPVGLALLAYLIWGKKMFSRSCSPRRHDRHHEAQSWGRHAYRVGQTTGNVAFDSYKAEALRRLEEEQDAFEAFLQRLRSSKDKSEFDSFMEDRARATAEQDAAAATASEAKPETTPEAKPETGARPGEY